MASERGESFSDVSSNRFVEDVLDFAVDASKDVRAEEPVLATDTAAGLDDVEPPDDASLARGDLSFTSPAEAGDVTDAAEQAMADDPATNRFDLPDDVVVVDVDAGAIAAPGSVGKRTLSARATGWARRVRRLYL